MPGATAKRIHLTRHAQAEHNVASDWTIADARLTPLGQQQSRELHRLTKNTIQPTAQLLVSSCMRRPLETALLGYPDLKKRLEGEGKPMIILDILQEVEDHPCDTPTHPLSELVASNDGIFADLDFSGLSSDYAAKQGIFDPDNAPERAKKVRHWLRSRPEDEIVVVAHGDILRNIVDGTNSSRQWLNAEIKTCAFVSDSDEEAKLVLVHDTKPKDATREPTSSQM